MFSLSWLLAMNGPRVGVSQLTQSHYYLHSMPCAPRLCASVVLRTPGHAGPHAEWTVQRCPSACKPRASPAVHMGHCMGQAYGMGCMVSVGGIFSSGEAACCHVWLAGLYMFAQKSVQLHSGTGSMCTQFTGTCSLCHNAPCMGHTHTHTQYV